MAKMRQPKRIEKAFSAKIGSRKDPRDNLAYMMSKYKADYRLINKVGIDNKTVLNTGGYFPIDEIFFARKVKKLYSIDLAPKVIDFARKLAKKELSPELNKKLTFKVADMTKLPFPDNYFDLSMSFSAIDHIPQENQRQKAISELARVTKKGGHVIVTLPNRLSIFKYLRVAKRLRAGKCPFGYEYWFTPWEAKEMLKRAGLKPIYFASTARVYPKSSLEKYLIYPKIKAYLGVRFGYLAEKP